MKGNNQRPHQEHGQSPAHLWEQKSFGVWPWVLAATENPEETWPQLGLQMTQTESQATHPTVRKDLTITALRDSGQACPAGHQSPTVSLP